MRPVSADYKLCARLTEGVANSARDATSFHHKQVEPSRLYARLDSNDPDHRFCVASLPFMDKVTVALNGEHVSAWHKFREPEVAGIICHRRNHVDGL
jgi:hypothetical protein